MRFIFRFITVSFVYGERKVVPDGWWLFDTNRTVPLLLLFILLKQHQVAFIEYSIHSMEN